MTNVDFGRYKRIVQYFWDPEPKNDDFSKAPVWCLGLQYVAIPDTPNQPSISANTESHPLPKASTPRVGSTKSDADLNGSRNYDEANDEGIGVTETTGAWPSLFLDDFESKIWLTYRSNFPPIARSPSPDAHRTSFSAGLRSQLVKQTDFTTDAGWGCMIRSGQSLLANALVLLKLGRGIPKRRRWFT